MKKRQVKSLAERFGMDESELWEMPASDLDTWVYIHETWQAQDTNEAKDYADRVNQLARQNAEKARANGTGGR